MISTLYLVFIPAVVTSGAIVNINPEGGAAAVIVKTLGKTADTSVLPLEFTAVIAKPVTVPAAGGFLIPVMVIVSEVAG